MNLLNYLDLYFESLIEPEKLDDFYYINNITLNEWNVLKHRIDYTIIDNINSIKSDKINSLEKIQKINPNIITKNGLINLNEFPLKKEKSYYTFIDKKIKGIVLLQKKSEQIIKVKKYQKINDLNSDDISLYVTKSFDGSAYVICYNNKMNKKNNNKLDYILFMINISKYPQPYKAGIVDTVAARKDVNGKNIIYPIGAYFIPGNKITPHRETVSRGARGAWYYYYTNKKAPLRPFAPIDDIKKPITIDKIDDANVFKKLNDNDYQKLKELNTKKDVDGLKKVKSGHYLDWVYILDTDLRSELNSLMNKLITNHKSEHEGFKSLNDKELQIAGDAMTFFIISDGGNRI
jgi:hypothetical protein